MKRGMLVQATLFAVTLAMGAAATNAYAFKGIGVTADPTYLLSVGTSQITAQLMVGGPVLFRPHHPVLSGRRPRKRQPHHK